MKRINKNSVIKYRDAVKIINAGKTEYAVIHNPEFVFPADELVPLSGKIRSLNNGLSAVVMDMDGTTATTELLCIHSLEYMVRMITGRPDKKSWKGLNAQKDYPYIIGNSTTKHIEYLITTYQDYIIPDKLIKSFFEAVVWTLSAGKDESRRAEARNLLALSGCGELINDKRLKDHSIESIEKLSDYYSEKYKLRIDLNNPRFVTGAAIEIYYRRYHEILLALKSGVDIPHINMLPADPGKLIEAMPGAAFFLSLVKGFLGENAALLNRYLINEYEKKVPGISAEINAAQAAEILSRLSSRFTEYPVKTALVTSSILYEAETVLNELFKLFRTEIRTWKLPDGIKSSLLKKFSSYSEYFDVIITASETGEMRLKPHRDLYSLALHKLGIPVKDFDKVIGFEDSESGTIALRAAGIKLCAAVPFAQTSGHNLKAASFVLKGGLPEAVIKHNLFLRK